MPLIPYEPPRRRHRFDIIAYDRGEAPVLVVEIKRTGDIRSMERLMDDTKRYVESAGHRAPFILIANPDKISLYRRDASGTWSLAHEFNSAEVLKRYDSSYGENPVYEHYLNSLVQAWLNDIAYDWHTKNLPEKKVFEGLDLLSALRDGSMAADAAL